MISIVVGVLLSYTGTWIRKGFMRRREESWSGVVFQLGWRRYRREKGRMGLLKGKVDGKGMGLGCKICKTVSGVCGVDGTFMEIW